LISRRLIGDGAITTSFSFIVSSSCILYDSAKPVLVDIEPDTANIDPNLIEDAIISRCVIRGSGDEPTPERRSAVRDHVMRRLRELTGGAAPAFPPQEAGVGCRPYFTSIHLQPFHRAEFGPKEGDVSHIELSGSASTATCWKRQSPRHRL